MPPLAPACVPRPCAHAARHPMAPSRPAPCPRLPSSPHHRQVCAPSNSALDEIVLRLISVGLTDQDGRVFTPNVVSLA